MSYWHRYWSDFWLECDRLMNDTGAVEDELPFPKAAAEAIDAEDLACMVTANRNYLRNRRASIEARKTEGL